MSIANFKKLTIAVVFAALAVIAPLVVSNTDAVFEGPDPVTNGKIAFASDSGKSIKTAFPDGSSSSTLYIDTDATIMGDPVWSPDKSKIAIVIAKSGQTHIYTLNGTGENQTPVALTQGSGESGGTDPSWSPDGSKLLFARQVGSASNIFIMDSDGSNQTQLTSGYTTAGRQAFDPHWSPVTGSKQIVFTVADTQSTPTMNSNIHTALLNSGETAFVSGSDVELDGASWNASDGADVIRGEYDPQFDPTGTKVVFVRRTPNGSYSIGTALANNSSTTYKTEISNAELGGPVFDPAYSPDGKYISFEPKANLLSVGTVRIYNTETKSISTFTSNGAEADWTYLADGEENPEALPPVSVECTVGADSNTCTVAVPEFCTSQFDTPPANGTSVITEGQLIYTHTGSERVEQNYVHIRDNGVSTSVCNVKILFEEGPGLTPNPKPPATGITGGIIGATLAGALAGGAIYYNEQKGKKNKKLKSEK
jgi:hypothetical protein